MRAFDCYECFILVFFILLVQLLVVKVLLMVVFLAKSQETKTKIFNLTSRSISPLHITNRAKICRLKEVDGCCRDEGVTTRRGSSSRVTQERCIDVESGRADALPYSSRD